MTRRNQIKISVGTQRERSYSGLGHRKGKSPLVLQHHEIP